ncbi:MAG TPA: sigma-70 family RNA polymerase sigma factor [Ktedonobacterales bacterium]|jgi:RNA polymerase sigma-70 factor (ECF subfamily)|nr:sigma-70 family RNA polymerase sigma factor [Ktedonobacterales bacterium]
MAQSTPQDDIALLQRIATGDKLALAALYERYQHPLFVYLLQHAGDRGMAEELLQDTFVAVWRGAAMFDAHFRGADTSVKAWIIGIARRQARDRLRRFVPATVDVVEAEQLADPAPDPEARALANVAQREVVDAFQRLPVTYREIALLALVQDLSYAEMAQILDVPLGTVKSRLSMAKRMLRTLLGAAEEGTR